MPTPEAAKSDLLVQRDSTTEEWVQRFRQDVATRDVLGDAAFVQPSKRSFSNFIRFLRKSQMKPYPFS